jgi:hypothetical protein
MQSESATGELRPSAKLSEALLDRIRVR